MPFPAPSAPSALEAPVSAVPRGKLRRRLEKLPELCAHEVVSPRIAPGLDGVRIGQLSDLHVRTGVKPRRLHLAVEMLNRLAPDLVVLTGDYVCYSAKPLGELTAALRDLGRPAYATLGNHDHACGADKVRDALERAGVTVLANEHRALTLGRGTLHLVGVDDSVTRHHDPEAAFSGVPEGASSVVLTHDPNSVELLHPYNPALVLSGHTHGGQVFVRTLTPFMAQKIGVRYLRGFFEREGAILYVNRGLGAGIPVRFGAKVEVAQLTLRSVATAANSAAA